MRIIISILIVSITSIVLGASCIRHNPDSCCSTQQQCDAFGLAQVTGCEGNKVCTMAGACIDPQCTTSAQCTSPDAPVCVHQLCVAVCQLDDDCMGVPGKSYCAPDGTCVGCKDTTTCTVDAPVCDMTDRTCRGCAQDSECSGGVCLEADGTCATDMRVVYLVMFGSDSGECLKASPCRTLPYAMTKVTSARNVIHIDGGSFPLGTGTVTIDRPVYVDASGTMLTGGGTGSMLSVSAFTSPVVLTHLTVGPTSTPTNAYAITVGNASLLRLFDATVLHGISVMGGTVDATSSSFTNDNFVHEAIKCSGGSVAATKSSFTSGRISTANCQLLVQRSRFDETNTSSVDASGGFITIENNLFIEAYELADLASVTTAAPGSTVRFNTFVNTSTVASDGVALFCDGTVVVTSNIFAYGSMHPHGPSGCQTRYSLYDQVALSQQTMGINNKVADGATFFVNKPAKDVHLAAGSPARTAGEPGLSVLIDFEGTKRPQPTGSAPDIGALEAP